MNRLYNLKKDKKHLIIYLMAGDPDLETTEKLIYLLDKSGVSVIELGVPFSDPIADGITIQKAGERALKQDVNLQKIFSLMRKIRKKVNTPIVLMTYYNIIFNYGIKEFITSAKTAGIDGAIIPDLPFDEEKEIYTIAKNYDFCLIYLISPVNTLERVKKIVEKSMGFVYYILIKGITGIKKDSAINTKIAGYLKKFLKKPVFAGFGISSIKQVKEILEYFDGVIIGSAFVNIIEKYGKNTKKLLKECENFIADFINEVKNAD